MMSRWEMFLELSFRHTFPGTRLRLATDSGEILSLLHGNYGIPGGPWGKSDGALMVF